jgi:hypothetical protein
VFDFRFDYSWWWFLKIGLQCVLQHRSGHLDQLFWEYSIMLCLVMWAELEELGDDKGGKWQIEWLGWWCCIVLLAHLHCIYSPRLIFIYYILYIIHYALYIIHYTLYIIHYILLSLHIIIHDDAVLCWPTCIA